MQSIAKRLSKLSYLAKSLTLTFIGVTLFSIGVAYFFVAAYRTVNVPPFLHDLIYIITLQPIDRWLRGVVFTIVGMVALGMGIWQMSDVAVIPLDGQRDATAELVVGYRQSAPPPTIAVMAGGAGILRLADLGRAAKQVTCVTPVQDPIEYYYRAASLFNFEKVLYVAPMPRPLSVVVTLDDGSRHSIKDAISQNPLLAERHVVDVELVDGGELQQVFQKATDAFAHADMIIFGPGGLFESIIPNLLIPEIRDAIRASHAKTIYICNLMTEPGLTTGFTVADHIRQFVRFGGVTPDYVLVNAQRIEPEIRRIYEAAHQSPVYLTPEEYEETMVGASDRLTARDIVVEGSVVVEADLASSVVQLSTSLNNPTESRAVQVLRHDPEKLRVAILEILKRH